jgi:hypothetical protein
MKRVVVGLALVAGILLSTAELAGADPVAAEVEFIERINRLRMDKGLAPLAVDGELTAVARAWSRRMADEQELYHNPELSKQVHDWRLIGENVGVGQEAESLHRAFVDSPAHYENLVEARFTHIGVGVVEIDGTMWVTENFKQPRQRPAAASAPKPTPRPVSRTVAPRPVRRPSVPVTARYLPTPTTMAPAPVPTSTTTVPPPPVSPSPPAEVGGRTYDRASVTPVPMGMLRGGAAALLWLVATRVLRHLRRPAWL